MKQADYKLQASDYSRTDDEQDEPFTGVVEIEITDVFDLHTISPREVRPVVEEYLRLAHERGFRSVRIIHGKGVGVQKRVVTGVLERSEFVEAWTDAPENAGGWGATVVRMKA